MLAIQGAAGITLGAATLAAAGALDIQGAAGITLGALTLAADGERGVVLTPWTRHVFTVSAPDYTSTAALGTALSIPAQTRTSTTTLGASLTIRSEDRTSYA